MSAKIQGTELIQFFSSESSSIIYC